MGVLRYAVNELLFRSGRSLVTAVSIALAVLAAIVLTSLASSYARALRVPIETVGADVIVQRQGDIPPKLEGLVFPHPNALVPADIVRQIKAIPGVIALTRAVYMWDLEPDRYESVLGIDDSEVGLAGLGRRLIDGKPITAASHSILVDSDYATKNHVKVGDSVMVGVDSFAVAGIVDAARSGKLVRADVYMPIVLAQALAATAPQVQALYPFGADDANLVLVKVNREQLQGVVEKVTSLIGKNGVVSSELSMRNALSGVLFLSQSMGLIIAAIIGLFAAAFVWRATATSVAERRREMAILQAIGWSWRHIGEQVVIENLALAMAGTAAGLAVALVVVLSLGHISVTVDLPWDLSSTPHFIPTAAIDRTQTITAPISISWLTAGIAAAGSLAISLLAVLAVLALPRPQPWSLLRAE
ncbi:MAG TPA: FtsX-like permease family protein [Pseudolabrys sp.]|nr:FtsX-like permease family protein [Pseudolabrys sp.]